MSWDALAREVLNKEITGGTLRRHAGYGLLEMRGLLSWLVQ